MNRLVLHPKDILAAPHSPEQLLDCLQDIKLVSSPLVHRDGYLTGPRFLQLITFLGCMPRVELDEPEQQDKEFCYVRIPPVTAQATLLTGNNTVRPRCPHCHGAILDWHAIAAAWPKPGTCPRCDARITADTVRWRENAGLGRSFIEIFGIHPSEAVPGDELLKRLQDTTGFPWKWFYVQQETHSA